MRHYALEPLFLPNKCRSSDKLLLATLLLFLPIKKLNLKLSVLEVNNFYFLIVWQSRVVNGPTSLGPNPARTRKYKPEPGPNPKKLFWSPNYARKKMKVMLGLKNLAMLPSYFYYVFIYLKQKAHFKPHLSPKFLSTSGPNPTQIARPTYNSVAEMHIYETNTF